MNIKDNTSENNSCEYPIAALHTAFTVVYSLVFSLGLVLNAVTLWVYFCNKLNSSSVMIYLKNLAIADFLLILSLLLKIINYSTDNMTIRKIYCTIGATLFYLNMYASILFMQYIGANRYLKIVRATENHTFHTVKTAKYISYGTWTLVLLLGGGFNALSINIWLSPVKTKICHSLLPTAVKTFYFSVHTVSIIVFIFVLVSLSFFYFQTTKRLKKSKYASNKDLLKSKKNMCVLITVFFICFVPYYLVRFPYILTTLDVISSCAWKKTLYYLKEFTVLLSTLNACLDPFIYFIFCKAFRAKLGLEKLHKRMNDFHINHSNGIEEGDFSGQEATLRHTNDILQSREPSKSQREGSF
ncbi:P2Y purinoceptor 14 [Amia ocellicauda]|uniref:P2Y purinoceptor 14 n=1 Tax=Amia ocellicauda TaxID=2972642 RepID=UPI003464AC48